jgi:hypothetical protein
MHLLVTISCLLLLSTTNPPIIVGQEPEVHGTGDLQADTALAADLELVGHIGAPAYAVAVQGYHAYVTDGDGLRIINVANPAAPVQVGFFDTQQYARGLAVKAPYVYVADDGDGIRIIDVADPHHPVEVGFSDTPGNAYDVEVAGNHAYVADWAGGLRIINVANPTAPVESGSFPMPGAARNVSVKDDRAYVAEGGYGLRVVDIADPTAPDQAVFYGTPYGIVDVAVSDDYAYVIDQKYWAVDPAKMRILRFTDPMTMPEIGAYSWTGGAESIAVKGDYAFVADYYSVEDSGLRIIDTSNPMAPTQAGFYRTGLANNVALIGNYVYVANVDTGLFVFWYGYPTETRIPISGGVLSSAIDNTSYIFPGNAFTDTTTITHTAKFPGSVHPTGNLVNVNHVFETTAIYSSTGEIASLVPGRTYTLSVRYTDTEKGPALENTLRFCYWDGAQWVKDPTSVVDVATNTITATPNRLALWAILGETRRLFLPHCLKTAI